MRKQGNSSNMSVMFKGCFVCSVCQELKSSGELYCIPEEGCNCVCDTCFNKSYANKENILLVED